jgi:hypothetical protein
MAPTFEEMKRILGLFAQGITATVIGEFEHLASGIARVALRLANGEGTNVYLDIEPADFETDADTALTLKQTVERVRVFTTSTEPSTATLLMASVLNPHPTDARPWIGLPAAVEKMSESSFDFPDGIARVVWTARELRADGTEYQQFLAWEADGAPTQFAV